MKVAFGAIISIVLLFIYVYLVSFGVEVVRCESQASCNSVTTADFNDRMASSLALIGGLVSALVIAVLSATKPGDAPGVGLMATGLSNIALRWTKIVTAIYLIVWLLAGLAAFLFGYLFADPDSLPALANLGQSWLGIAVGAGYAYFGIKAKA